MTTLTIAPKRWYSWDFIVTRDTGRGEAHAVRHDATLRHDAGPEAVARAKARALHQDDGRPVADMDLSCWREKGVLSVQGADYRVSRERALSGDFILEHAGSVLARATKPSAFHRSFVLSYNGRRYTLQAKSPFRRAFVLLDGAVEIGSLTPDSAWTRRGTVTLPDDWPLPVMVFAIWLTIILWKRDADGGAVAASA